LFDPRYIYRLSRDFTLRSVARHDAPRPHCSFAPTVSLSRTAAGISDPRVSVLLIPRLLLKSTMATVAPPLVALVDFHDAKVSEVRLLPGGCVILSFSTINVIERTAEEDRFDVWVYRMTLLTEDVKSLQSSGTWSVDTFVAELTVDGEAPKGAPWAFGADGGAHQFALAFIGGAS